LSGGGWYNRAVVEENRCGVWNPSADVPFKQFRSADDDIPRGTLRAENWSLTYEPMYWAIPLAYRPLQEGWTTLKLEDFALLPEEHAFDGRRQLVLETSHEALQARAASGGTPLVRQLWVSPEQDYAITRYSIAALGAEPSELYTIYYTHEQKSGWHPTGWRYVMGSHRDVPHQVIDAKVQVAEFNRDLDPSLFDMTFPDGTWVQDHRLQPDGSRERIFVAFKDGDLELTKAELQSGLTYRELVASGPRRVASRQRTGLWIVTANAVAVCILVGLWLWRRRRRSQLPREETNR
jgi:hypothetical protein